MNAKLVGKQLKTKNGSLTVMEYNVWTGRYWCRLDSGKYNGFDIGNECLLSEKQIINFINKKRA